MAEGGCYCGHVRYEVADQAIGQSICHCRDCQKNSGASSVAWIMLADSDFKVTSGTLKTRNGKNGAERSFCPECGSGIAYHNAQMLPDLVDVQTATLDDPEKFAPEIHIQLADQLTWEKTAHELPGFDGYPPQE